MIIIGAGLAGLLAGNMLRHRDPILYEQQKSLPNNHSAVLRFRTAAIGDITGIPFRRVQMIKTTVPWQNYVADALKYSYKGGGKMRSDRSIVHGTVTEERYIAPADLIARLARNLKMHFGKAFKDWHDDGPKISTIPMPILMRELHYRHSIDFQYSAGVNIRATIADCDAYASVIVPDPALPFKRISLTGNELIVEVPRKRADQIQSDWVLSAAINLLGIEPHQVSNVKMKDQLYSEIMPIDDDARRAFIAWATDQHNIFSLGRYAVWKPGLLLDDLVQDIRKIDRWIGARPAVDRYSIVHSR